MEVAVSSRSAAPRLSNTSPGTALGRAEPGCELGSLSSSNGHSCGFLTWRDHQALLCTHRATNQILCLVHTFTLGRGKSLGYSRAKRRDGSQQGWVVLSTAPGWRSGLDLRHWKRTSGFSAQHGAGFDHSSLEMSLSPMTVNLVRWEYGTLPHLQGYDPGTGHFHSSLSGEGGFLFSFALSLTQIPGLGCSRTTKSD